MEATQSFVSLDTLLGQVGQEIGVSEWLRVDQAMITAFAETTGDHQFIHVDPERASQTLFGGTIAHGFLTLSLFSTLIDNAGCARIEGMTMGLNYGGNKVRFLHPVRSGSQVRGRFKLLELEEKKPSQFQMIVEFSVEIEGVEKPALMAEWIIQIFF